MNVHYLQHVDFEGLGFIETWLTATNHRLSATRFYEPDYSLPSVSEIDALIILGGPMGTGDEALYPWLVEEKAFIKDCLQAGKKILGICLGAQLVATCLGANVDQAAHKEIGWFPVQPTASAQQLDWFNKLFQDHPVVFHWHGDRFEIPEGGVNLLTSEANSNQAFYYSDTVLGLQFHLEVTEHALEAMIRNGAEELTNAAYVQHADELTAGKSWIQSCNKRMSEILSNWLRENEGNRG